MNRIILFLTLTVWVSSSVLAQQLTNRTGLNEADFVFNPALTAVDPATTFTVEHQRQWVGYNDAPVTYRVSVQAPLADARMGIGLMLSQSTAIGLSRTLIGGTYAYHFGVGQGLVSGGLLVGLESWKNDLQNVAAVAVNDPSINFSWLGAPQLSFGAGIRYQTNKRLGEDYESGFFIGIGSNQLLTSSVKDTDSDQPVFQRLLHANGHAGYKADNGDLAVEFSAWAEYSQNAPLLVTARAKVELENIIWGALAYNVSNSVVAPQFGVVVLKEIYGKGNVTIGGQLGIPFGTAVANPGVSGDFFLGYRAEF